MQSTINEVSAQTTSTLGSERDRISIAHRLAAQATAKVGETVFEAVMNNPSAWWEHDRYMLSLDFDRENHSPTVARVNPIDCNAFVMTTKELSHAIGEADFLIDSTDLSHLASACCQRLAGCSKTIPEIDKLRSTIESMDALSQGGFSEISAIAGLALARMEQPGGYRCLSDMAYALIAIKQKAENTENGISNEADQVGCHSIDKFHERRRNAEYESHKEVQA